MNLIIGIVISSCIAFIAYKKRSLSLSGVIAAIIVGTIIYYLGGVLSFTLMMGFFISSSILSKLLKERKKALDKIHEKGDRRDWVQVVANGGVAIVYLILYRYYNNETFLVISSISFAVSNSDTWASEVGVLSKGKTVSIITFKKIEKGISGGISLLGTLSALAGATFISIVFSILYIVLNGFKIEIYYWSILIVLLGFLGSIIDSILGATIQGHYYDEENNCVTEKKKGKLIKGIKIVNNDIVNILSNLLATTMALIILI